MRDLSELTGADFEAVTGSVFEVTDPGVVPVSLRLAEVDLLPERPGHRQPFALRFRGPQAPVLAPVVHHLVHAEMGEMEIFLGPIAADAEGTTYEAVFN